MNLAKNYLATYLSLADVEVHSRGFPSYVSVERIPDLSLGHKSILLSFGRELLLMSPMVSRGTVDWKQFIDMVGRYADE